MVGNMQKFMCLLVTPKVGTDSNGLPNKELAAEATQVSANSKTIADAQKDDAWAAYIQKVLDQYNNDPKACVSRAQRIQKFRICPQEFSPITGELGPTLKLKRPVVSKMYQKVIREMYGDHYKAI